VSKGTKVALIVLACLLTAGLHRALPAITAYGIRSLLVEPFIVPNATMAPTIAVDDRVLAAKNPAAIKSGDIVVFADPTGEHAHLIKRVIATGDQTIDVREGSVFVDGKRLDESYVEGRPTVALNPTVQYPLTVPRDHVWVMSDNRTNSADSRIYGPVALSKMQGVAVAIYWPPGHARGL
jgi:signal peptidase I